MEHRSVSGATPLRVVDVAVGTIAAASAAAAIVHFAYAPVHFDESTSHGAFFAVIGWAQLILAGALAFRLPQLRFWLVATAVVNGGIVAIWLVSRTSGLPGEEAEPVAFPDALATALEMIAVLGAVAILLNLLTDRAVGHRPTFGFAGLGALATMLLVSLSIAPSFAGEHHHGAGEDHDHAAGDDDHGHGLEGEEIAAGDEHAHDDSSGGSTHDGDDHGHSTGGDDHDDHSTGDDDHNDGDHDHTTTTGNHDDGHGDHGHGSTTTMAHGGHGHGSTTSTTHGGHGHGSTTTTTHGGHDHDTTSTTSHDHNNDDWAATRLAALTGHLAADQIAEFRQRSLDYVKAEIRARSGFLAGIPEPERTARIDTFATWTVDHALDGELGHSHAPTPYVPITDPNQQRALRLQLAAAGTVIPKYPTAADAVAAGYTQVTPYVPGIAAHYINFSLTDRVFDPAKPEILLYNGNRSGSELVGVSYAMFGAEPGPDDGFVGPNDTWHNHPSLCILGSFVIGPDHTPRDLCRSVGANQSTRPNSGLWMMHLWQVPGWDSAWGMFSGENPGVNMATSDILDT